MAYPQRCASLSSRPSLQSRCASLLCQQATLFPNSLSCFSSQSHAHTDHYITSPALFQHTTFHPISKLSAYFLPTCFCTLLPCQSLDLRVAVRSTAPLCNMPARVAVTRFAAPSQPRYYHPNPPVHLKQGADAASASAGDLSPSIIDMDIFSQLLEMDDEDDREFSKSIVWNYFDQAITTFKEMDVALSTKNLTELSTLGHFLKGSSAAVGVIKVRDHCEHMQHYGKCHGEDGVSDLTEEEALEKLTATLRDVKVQYREAAKALKAFYDEEDEEEEEAEEEAGKKEEEVKADKDEKTESKEVAATA